MARPTEAGAQTIPADADATQLGEVAVEPGDMISLVVGPKGAHQCDTTLIDLVIAEVDGHGRIWNLTEDVVKTLHAGNPHTDSQGNADVWHFYSEKSTSVLPPTIPSLPPMALASQATSAQEFIKELHARKLTTIRQRTRVHEEQTWEGAVTAMCGANLPPHPKPPAGSEPTMQVQVPSERLTAQWNLGPGIWSGTAQKQPEERTAVVQRLSLRHPRRRDLHDPGGAGPDGFAPGRRRWIRPMGIPADATQGGAGRGRRGIT